MTIDIIDHIISMFTPTTAQYICQPITIIRRVFLCASFLTVVTILGKANFSLRRARMSFNFAQTFPR